MTLKYGMEFSSEPPGIYIFFCKCRNRMTLSLLTGVTFPELATTPSPCTHLKLGHVLRNVDRQSDSICPGPGRIPGLMSVAENLLCARTPHLRSRGRGGGEGREGGQQVAEVGARPTAHSWSARRRPFDKGAGPTFKVGFNQV